MEDIFNFLDSEFNKQDEALKRSIEQKYASQRGSLKTEIGGREKKTELNFEEFDQTYGATEKDRKNKDIGLKANTQRDHRLLDQTIETEYSAARQKLEKSVWKDYGGSRIKAKEMAFGLDDPEVKAHYEHLEKQKQKQRELEDAVKNNSTSKNTLEFNKDLARQNMKEQFRDKGGKTR